MEKTLEEFHDNTHPGGNYDDGNGNGGGGGTFFLYLMKYCNHLAKCVGLHF
jgi:hypothetical protein